LDKPLNTLKDIYILGKKDEIKLIITTNLKSKGLGEKFGERARTYTTTLKIAQVDDDEWVGCFGYGFDGKELSFS
jgi:hypothetical protein